MTDRTGGESSPQQRLTAGIERNSAPAPPHCSDMEHCSDWRDWTILPTGHGTGSIGCGDLRGWFTRNSHGHIQIDWTNAPEGGLPPDVQRAATEACEKADGGQRTSKAGRNNAGG